MQTEENFRRSKTEVVYQNVSTVIDKSTGEILQEETNQKLRVSTEPDYIKIYYRTMLAVNGIDGLSLDFVLALASVISYTNNPDEPILFYNNRAVRDKLAALCAKKDGEPISDNMVARYIKTAKDVGLLFPTQYRGTYEVNPWMIAKGKWQNISKLQAGFTFDGEKKRWFRNMETVEEQEQPSEQPSQPQNAQKEKEEKAS